MGSGAKTPVTVRMTTETQARLKALTNNGLSFSSLVNQAVEAFLDGKPFVPENRAAITVEEIEQLLPVLKALGKPVHVGLFLELLDTQQGR